MLGVFDIREQAGDWKVKVEMEVANEGQTGFVKVMIDIGGRRKLLKNDTQRTKNVKIYQ